MRERITIYDKRSGTEKKGSMAVATKLSVPCGLCSGSSGLFEGSRSSKLSNVNRGEARVSCRRKDIHPKFYKEAKVYCNGENVMTTGGTQAEYVVDVWSGNHPFFQGNKTAVVLDADRVDKFRKRYGSMSAFSTVPVLTHGEVVFERQKRPPAKGKGKK